MRKAFSLITAIIILVVMATLLVLTLSLSMQTSKQTGDIYLKEQAQLLARSATEYALLAISGHERNITTGCVENINITYPSATAAEYDINITIMYIGNNMPCTNARELDDAIATTDSNGTVIIDTTVTNLVSQEPIRYHRRTIQKP